MIFIFYRPPAGCLQYFTGLSGRITSFNGAQTGDAQSMLQNLNYNICIKRGAGMDQFTIKSDQNIPPMIYIS